GPCLPGGQDGWRQRFPRGCRILHPLLQLIEPVINALVPALAHLCAPLGGTTVLQRPPRCAGHRPALPWPECSSGTARARLTSATGLGVQKNRECSPITQPGLSISM